MIDNNIKVYSVKSDAFVIAQKDVEQAQTIIDFHNNVGGWRLAKTSNIIFPKDEFKLIDNKFIEIPEITPTRIELCDEWDTDAICQDILKYKRVIIRALVPGSGKSYICEKLHEKGHNVLFVCPTNVLVENFETSMTTNKFFGISVDLETLMSKFDASDYDVVVFDEIYFSDIQKLSKIKQYSDTYPDKILVATGDVSQLEPINALTNTQDYDAYADQCINIIFPYEIYLLENKRLKKPEDKIKLENIRQDLFINNLGITQIIKKYFRYTTDITQSVKNVAYKNDTCEEVSNHIRRKLGKTVEFEVGEALICRGYFKEKKYTFNVNFTYIITDVSEATLTLLHEKSKVETVVPLEKIRKHFIYAYCQTAHSLQGSSIDSSITIFDYKFYFVSRKWLWVAITRARELDNVHFYKYDEPEFNKHLCTAYFNNKVKNYKKQDNEAKREISKDNYVNADWFYENMEKCCEGCGNGFFYTVRNGNAFTNLTAQRKDNNFDHNLNNISPYCIYCNCSAK